MLVYKRKNLFDDSLFIVVDVSENFLEIIELTKPVNANNIYTMRMIKKEFHEKFESTAMTKSLTVLLHK
jgi:hypothetical protein